MRHLIFIIFIFCLKGVIAQDTLLIGHLIPEIVFEENKEERERFFTPQQMEVISSKSILQSNPSNTADILQKSGAVTVQMSQSGGGSPIIRGFEANRILLVVDGVRLNNAIFRSGHLQNMISISPYVIDNIDLVFGPASVKYGSDALGGVVHMHTKKPTPSQATKRHYVQKISTVNKGVTTHFDLSWSEKKWSFLHAVSVQKHGNLKMGNNRFHGYEDWGKEAHITKGAIQLNTSYKQADFIQKVRYDANEYWSFLMNTQFSTTTNIPRFDKLNDQTEYGTAKFAVWEYGPQKRFLNALSIQHQKKRRLFNDLNIHLAIQSLEESRFTQKVEQSLFERYEKVWVYSMVTDFNKSLGHNTLNYGFDVQYNRVNSSANEGTPTRYADGGSEMGSFSVYSQYKHPLSRASYLSVGLRYSKNQLKARFLEIENYQLPFDKLALDNEAVTGGLGYFHEFGEGWEGSIAVSSGFRSPNVDDVTKVFAKNEAVTVPNQNLSPEYSYNSELSFSKKWNEKSFLSATAYYTSLRDAIIKSDFVLNNQDSLVYDGELLPVVANQNIQEAFVWGYNLKADISINKQWSTRHTINYTFGQEIGSQNYLDHIPPVYGKSELAWLKNEHQFQVFIAYNASKPIENYSPNGSDNPQEATAEGSPAWWTLNTNYQYEVSAVLTGQLGIENILDTHYKTYSSGISAPGRNLILTLKASF